MSKKLKTDPNDPNKVLDEHRQALEEDENEDRNGIQYWQQLIYESRYVTVAEREARKKRLTSDQFMARQQTVKQSVNQLLSENKALKQEQKMERMKS